MTAPGRGGSGGRRALADDAATTALGAALARALPAATLVVHLSGDLGAGKTTLVRGVLGALGHAGRVKSPTYTLVEPYAVGGRTVHHLDLYRLKTPEEAEGLGLRDLAEPGDVVLVEWPEKGAGHIPPADLVVHLAHAGEARSAQIEGLTPVGRGLVDKLSA